MNLPSAAQQVRVLSESATGCADLTPPAAATTPEPLATPGACVQYLVSLNNPQATETVPMTSFLMTLPEGLIYHGTSFSGFGTAPDPVQLPAPTVCSATAPCEITATAGEIAPASTATIDVRAVID